MNLRDFAENILFSGSFEKKLFTPLEFSDEKPGTPFHAPALPVRDVSLRFHQDSSGHARLTFPKDGSLKSNEARAKIFHAFANHELLAMELMALAILKFTGAPKSFRLGLGRCITEEQAHLKLYLQRMHDFGVEFGNFPVNGFFWNVLRDMKSPVDFVTGMSLTFEQANLDFSHHYKTLFKEIGDTASSEIMERVYREEIGHVKFGVQWFDKWRTPSETQWKFYCDNLTLPLTPQRAKGVAFSPKHREGTGLDSDYLEKLEAYSHSRGRPPRVFLFNSNCELEWAAYLKKQSTFQAPKFQEEAAADLASLMLFLGHREDIVALPNPPSLEMIRNWREWGFSTPNFIEYSSKKPALLIKELNTFKVASLDPWGWSPLIAKELDPFYKSVLALPPQWPPQGQEQWLKLAPCYQKSSVPDLLRNFLHAHPEWKDIICLPEHSGKTCASLESVLAELQTIVGNESLPAVLKSPLGSSGFNMIRVLSMPPDTQQMGWIKNTLENQGCIVIEPWQKRIADFSIQIEVDRFANRQEDRINILGFTRMLSDNRGQYGGHQLGGKFEDLSEEVRKLFYQDSSTSTSMLKILNEAARSTGNWLFEKGFHGPAGIDAFVFYCKKTGRVRLKPIVEVNARFTMGRVALKLEEHLTTGSSGLWIHMSKQRLAKLGFNDWDSWLENLKKQTPIELVRPTDSTGMVRLKSGVFPTNDPNTAKSFLSVLLVGGKGVSFLPGREGN